MASGNILEIYCALRHMRKYQSVEKVELATPDQHKIVEVELHKVGKTSLKQTSDEERMNIIEKLDKPDTNSRS